MVYSYASSQFIPIASNRCGPVQGAQLFNKWLERGLMANALGRLMGRKMHLNSLTAPMNGNGRDLGIRTVPIRRIGGSEGRCNDFDRFFRPLQDNTRERWLSVWRAFVNGFPLPPVELVRVGENYFVRDGHHRISVAAALGQLEIEAHVVEWSE